MRAAEQKTGLTGLAEAVARNYAKLLAYKDEYEVARLYAEAAFQAQLDRQFEGDYQAEVPPRPAAVRQPRSQDRPSAQAGVRSLDAAGLQGAGEAQVPARHRAFDLFGYTRERSEERALIGEYEALLDELLAGLTPANHALAVRLASMPDDIKGYGHVKDAHLEKARRKQAELLGQWRNPELDEDCRGVNCNQEWPPGVALRK